MSGSIITKTIFLCTGVIAVLFIVACAAIAPPSGGPEDKIPPKFLSSIPVSGSTQFKGGKVKLLFSEYIEEKSLVNSITISPVTDPAVKIEYEDDEVHLAFPDNLLNDQTYIVTVNRNLKDERKVALEKTIQIAFSTGDVIEEGKISGRVYGNEKYAAHLWRANTVFDDSLYLTKPLYVSEADDNGFFTFSYLSAGIYAVMAVERSASGLPIVPSRMMYGMSPKKIYNLVSNDVIENIPFMAKRETPTLKLSHVDWKGTRWGWIYFNQDLSDAVFKNATLTDSDSKVYRPRIFPDIIKKDQFLVMIDDTLSEGKAELKIEKIISKKINEASANVNFRFSLKPDTLNLLLENPSKSILINKDNSSGPIIPFIFSKPIISTDDFTYELVVDSDTISLIPDWKNPISFPFTPPNGWKEKTDYRISILGERLTPIEGKSLKDSIIYIDIASQKKVGYGAITGTLKKFGTSMLVQLKQATNEGNSFYSSVNSKSEFYINNVPEGKYQLIMIDDLDKNNAFSYGTVSPYKNSEWFYAHPDTFEVRANWDKDVGQISMEEK